jgi:hypothetical protein
MSAPTQNVGYVTNLDVHPGDYASAGTAVLAVIDSHSYRVNGYFEETKLPYLHEGDAAIILLMSGNQELRGHIESLARGITDRDNPAGPRLLGPELRHNVLMNVDAMGIAHGCSPDDRAVSRWPAGKRMAQLPTRPDQNA